MSSHSGGKVTVVWSGGAATLDISQYSFTGLKSGFIFYFFGYVFGSFFAVDGLDTFCHNDDGVGFSFFQSFDNGVADVVDIIG